MKERVKMEEHIITGATGNLGSNIMNELLLRSFEKKKEINLTILGRDNNQEKIGERVSKSIREDFVNYYDKEDKKNIIEKAEKKIFCIGMNLDVANCGLERKEVKTLSKKKYRSLIHCAGVTGFKEDSETVNSCKRTNIDGINKLFRLANEIKPEIFIYVSSAYSSGRIEGKVHAKKNYEDEIFANSYQKSKSIAEKMLKEYSSQYGIPVYILRPSTISGRLIHNKIGKTTKFDVFYGWGKTMLRFKSKMMNTSRWEEVIREPINIDLRIHVNKKSGLNIVPVDWCAKMIVNVAENMRESGCSHIVNTEDINHIVYLDRILKTINIKNVKFVDKEPNDKSPIEEIYYQTLGTIFGTYVTNKLEFDHENIEKIRDRNVPICPIISENKFDKLMEYAIENKFGLY